MKIAPLVLALTVAAGDASAYEKFSDATLLGIALGKPAAIQSCVIAPDKLCAVNRPAEPPASGQFNEFRARVPSSGRPTFMIDDNVLIGTIDNEVVEVAIFARTDATSDALRQLRDKFGDPDSTDFDSAEWNVSDGHKVLAIVRLERSGTIVAVTPKMIEYDLAQRKKEPHL